MSTLHERFLGLVFVFVGAVLLLGGAATFLSGTFASGSRRAMRHEMTGGDARLFGGLSVILGLGMGAGGAAVAARAFKDMRP